MPITLSAAVSGQLSIGNQFSVNRLGYGAMRITGQGVWGAPRDEAEALRTLRRLPELGVNFIDTADSYGPATSETLIRKALHPYSNMVIATKGGLVRTGPDRWHPLGRPEYLRQQVHMSLRLLGVEQLDLWQLHRIDPKVPRDEQFGAIKMMLDEGLIRQAGLSEVGIEEIQAASKFFRVATVQNRYNLIERQHEAVLEYAVNRGIVFIPWYPLAAGELARPGTALDSVAQRHGASTSQIALAWILQRHSSILPIPGTSQVKHLEENVAAARLSLSSDEFASLDAAGRQIFEANQAQPASA